MFKVSTMKTKLNCCGQSNKVQYITKMRQDNAMTNPIGMVYAKNEVELSLPIRQGMIYDEDNIGQLCDRSYRCELC